MLLKRFLIGAFAASLAASVAFAQSSTQPTGSMSPAYSGRHATTSRPAAGTQTLPNTAKVNLNTATAEQLDALPQIGKARAKVIMTERAKAPFKDWNDFDTRTAHTSVDSYVKSKIKDLVTF